MWAKAAGTALALSRVIVCVIFALSRVVSCVDSAFGEAQNAASAPVGYDLVDAFDEAVRDTGVS